MATSQVQLSKPPQDIVAIFHACFHPTRGNVLDWSLKATDDVQLDGVEFSALPSGLHLVERDVVYFTTKDSQRGVCVFYRRQTSEQGQRGFRLSSLGILLARSVRPRPWRHLAALKALTQKIYGSLGQDDVRELREDDWAPAQQFFEERRVRNADLGGAGDWHRWSEELDDKGNGRLDVLDMSMHTNPTLHLPHVLRVLGPSSLTLYKHVLGRRRILIYTQPPVEPACMLCQVAADMCFEDQTLLESPEGTTTVSPARLKGKQEESINVLGIVTLHDIGRLERESETGRGWVACTTDAVFLEKPQYYDLIIDITTFSAERASRPTFQLSVKESNGRSRRPSYRLSMVNFTWSDVKLWNELDRILQLDADINGSARVTPSLWTDVWRLYEDVCLACAGLWTGRTWRNRHGGEEAEADEQELTDGAVRVRAHGEGIEGRPMMTIGRSSRSRSYRRASKRYFPSPWATASPTQDTTAPRDAYKDDPDEDIDEGEDRDGEDENDAVLVRNRQCRTTLALLQTFHVQTRFWLERLAPLLPPPPQPTDTDGVAASETAAEVQLSPRDVLELELSPLSSLDARFVEWLTEEYGFGATRVSVRRGWRDLLGLMFAIGGGGPPSSS